MGVRRGVKLSDETKSKIRSKLAGRKPEAAHTPESHAKISAAKRGRKRPDMVGNTLTKGVKLSEDHRCKVVGALKRWRDSIEPELFHDYLSLKRRGAL